MVGKFSLKMPNFHVAFRDLLNAVNLRHGTHSSTSLPKEGTLWDFFTLKNLTALARSEPAIHHIHSSYFLYEFILGL